MRFTAYVWTQQLVDGLDVALNEADVSGLSYDEVAGVLDMRIEVLALPEIGPVDIDTRRVLRFTGVTSLELTDRRDAQGPTEPAALASLADIAPIFTEHQYLSGMYGWKFIDDPDPRPDIRAEPSLRLGPGPLRSGHSFDWFVEYSVHHDETTSEGRWLNGTVWFTDLEVYRAEGTPLTLDEFAAGGTRWWQAFNAKDPRVGGEAQAATSLNAIKWEPRRVQ